MADSQFDILIKLHADLAGAKSSLAELKELKRQAIATGVSTGDLDKELASAERSAAAFGKKVEDAGKKGEAKIQGLHRAFHRLGSIVPGVGNLIQSAVSLPALGVTALAVGLGVLIEKFVAYKAKIEAAAKAMDELNLSKITALRDATATAASEMAKFNTELARASESNDPLRGRKFGSEEEELTNRQGLRGNLDAQAVAALAAAEANKNSPVLIAAQADLKKAQSEEAKLRAEAKEAGSPESRLRALETYKRTPGAGQNIAFAQSAYQAAVAADVALKRNQETITSNQALVGGFSVRQTDLDARASRAGGFATSNRSRITALNESISESNRQRRAGLSDQLQAGGFGLVEANQLVGANEANARRANGERVTGMDAVDYNTMLNRVKAGMQVAFFKSITEAFSDGVATPDEITKIKEYLRNKSARP